MPFFDLLLLLLFTALIAFDVCRKRNKSVADGWMDGWMKKPGVVPAAVCKVSSANVRSRYWPPANKELPPSVPTTLLVALDQLVTK